MSTTENRDTAIEKYLGIKEELDHFVATFIEDAAEEGHVDTAKVMCMQMVETLTETYNGIVKRYQPHYEQLTILP